MNRLERVRQLVDDILRQQQDEEERRAGFVHLYSVAAVCALLAQRRGLDPELCAAAGMLHDISSYMTGDPSDHARLSSIEARDIMSGLHAFTPAEVDSVCEAIASHSAKDATDGPMHELIKDADVLQHYLYNPALTDTAKSTPGMARLRRVLAELAVAPPAS